MNRSYIMRAITEDEFQETACGHALAVIDDAGAAGLLQLRSVLDKLSAEHPDLYRMEFWNGVANLSLVPLGDLSDELDAIIGTECVAVVPAGFALPENAEENFLGSEYAILVVDRWGASFRFCVRHEGTSLHTGDIAWDSVEENARP